MKQQFEGTLVRFRENGVGVIDVPEQAEYVYFTPGHIVGYRGETVPELKAGRGGWSDGSTVVVEGEVAGGAVRVASVDLKR